MAHSKKRLVSRTKKKTSVISGGHKYKLSPQYGATLNALCVIFIMSAYRCEGLVPVSDILEFVSVRLEGRVEIRGDLAHKCERHF